MIDKLAYVHPDAKIGEGVIIDPFAYVCGDVEIGDNTHVYAHASVLDGARIGKNCNIHPGAVIAGVPQDLKFKGEYSLAIIGDNTTIRECATVNRGSASREKTVVGNNCLIMAYAHVAHDCILGNNIILANNVSVAGEVEIDDWAILGGHVAVHQFSKIGSHVMVSGGSLVSKDIPPFVMAGHNPISFCGLNIVGLRRRGFTAEQIAIIKDVYNTLYLSGKNVTNACAEIEANIEKTEYRDMILDFVRSSSRGIIRGAVDSSSSQE